MRRPPAIPRSRTRPARPPDLHPLHSGLAKRLASRQTRRATIGLAGGVVAVSGIVVALHRARAAQRRAAAAAAAPRAAYASPPGPRGGAARDVAGQAVARGRDAASDTVAVLREGYRETSSRENAILNMLVAFLATFVTARTVTYLIRSGRTVWPLRNVVVGGRHIHHFVPGMTLTLIAGSISIGVRDKDLDRWLALPFGAGAALVLDESALLLQLEDVYWSEEGVLSLQIGVACAALLGIAALVGHLLQRGAPARAERPERAATPAPAPATSP
ncbi:MAG: hypothetical protein QOD73_1583 [Solirubrobacteraceae bacterium]|nr:hypothetical protein [Solirubrobacteraceae bacterium]